MSSSEGSAVNRPRLAENNNNNDDNDVHSETRLVMPPEVWANVMECKL